jgi:hypothetical protein
MAVAVEWRLRDGALVLTYRVSGAGGLTMPAPVAPDRADGLWKTTCFELFLGLQGKTYREFNFSPSTRWASYDFTDYREGGANATLPAAPLIAPARDGATVTLPAAVLDDAVVAALTAVIDEGGHTSYWALAHDTPRPDFHRRSCFTLQLGAAEAP